MKRVEPARVDVLGAHISALDEARALRFAESCLSSGRGGYVCFVNVHTAVLCWQDAEFRAVTNGACMALADGKPIYWAARQHGPVGHVPGPDFMLSALRRFPTRRHFLYGGAPGTLEQLARKLTESISDLNICGMYSPPFRELTSADKAAHLSLIRSSGAEYVWVGLGAPKQERWMSEAAPDLRPAVLFGVGAAFDFHAQVIARAPAGMRALGLEWLHRLAMEPSRLWQRYLMSNTMFIGLLALRTVTRKRGTTRRGDN